jgi:hypothetical protein
MPRTALILCFVPMLLAASVPAGAASLQLAQSTTEMIAPTAPPALPDETIPPPPSATMAWVAGHWSWSGQSWVWVAGHYLEQPAPRSVWVPGHWVQRPEGWLWVEGKWQVAEQ